MLESEATKKMCPLQKVPNEPFVYCQGTLCMMWEEWQYRTPDTEDYMGKWVKPDEPDYVPSGDCSLRRSGV